VPEIIYFYFMTRKTLTLILLFLLPLACFSQFTIKGKIIDKADNKPVPGVSAFLSNSSAGSSTTVDGIFTINNVRGGQYELVVSMLGYETYRKTLLVNQDITLDVIVLTSKITTLKEVSIRPDPDWERNYQDFKRDFLGSSDLAQKCKILNPESIYVHFDKEKIQLTASSSDFIVIENRASGYRVRYLLNNFLHDSQSNLVYFAGSAAFEQLEGTESEKRTWEKTRLTVYKGSSMHFLRSVIANQLPEEGFIVLRLIRKLNPDYHGGPEKKYNESLVTPPLEIPAFVKLTTTKGIYVFTFNDCLYVNHLNKPIKTNSSLHLGSSDSSTVLILGEQYVVFDNNGIFVDPASVTFEGKWGESRIAELLPVDYEPALNK